MTNSGNKETTKTNDAYFNQQVDQEPTNESILLDDDYLKGIFI